MDAYRCRRRLRFLSDLLVAVGATEVEEDMMPSDFAAPVKLDYSLVRIENDRTSSTSSLMVVVTGYSRKRSHPLWVWTEDIEPGSLGAHLFDVGTIIGLHEPSSPERLHFARKGGLGAHLGDEPPASIPGL